MKQVYVSKITSTDQLSIRKEVRRKLGLSEEYVLLEPIGDTIVLRRIRTMREKIFEYFEREAKSRGLTRKDLQRAIKTAKRKAFEEPFDEDIR